jgi:hypothetical protein
MKKLCIVLVAGLLAPMAEAYHYPPQNYQQSPMNLYHSRYIKSYDTCKSYEKNSHYPCNKQENISYRVDYTPYVYPYNHPHQYPSYTYQSNLQRPLSIIQKNVFPNRIDVWIEKNITGANGYDMTCTPYNTIYAGAQVEKAGLCKGSDAHTPLTINNLFSDTDYECRVYAQDRYGKTLAQQTFWIHTPQNTSSHGDNIQNRNWYHLSERYFNGHLPEWGSGKTYKPNKCSGLDCYSQ